MKIMVAYAGGSDIANRIVQTAINHAKVFKGTIHLVTSLEEVSEKEAEALDKAEKQLAYVKESFKKEGIPCETHVLVRGVSPGEDIVDFAKDQKVDEIVIGIEKKSKVGKLLFGSNAQHIILESPCPVVSVK
jgi:nucleotide-binding universal stress UspA family protein